MSDKKPDAINSVIGEGTSFKGEISSPGTLRVAGEIVGSINVKGDVYVVGKGHVHGDMIGSRVVVSGSIDGNITATKGLEILKTGKVNGEITCDKLIIEEGSLYQGKVNVCSKVEISKPPANESIFEIKDV